MSLDLKRFGHSDIKEEIPNGYQQRMKILEAVGEKISKEVSECNAHLQNYKGKYIFENGKPKFYTQEKHTILRQKLNLQNTIKEREQAYNKNRVFHTVKWNPQYKAEDNTVQSKWREGQKSYDLPLKDMLDKRDYDMHDMKMLQIMEESKIRRKQMDLTNQKKKMTFFQPKINAPKLQKNYLGFSNMKRQEQSFSQLLCIRNGADSSNTKETRKNSVVLKNTKVAQSLENLVMKQVTAKQSVEEYIEKNPKTTRQNYMENTEEFISEVKGEKSKGRKYNKLVLNSDNHSDQSIKELLNDQKTLVNGQKVNKLLSLKNVKYDFKAYKGKNSSVLLKKK